jgi:hypothetical protein
MSLRGVNVAREAHHVRVNLGCGDRYADGWLNVDHGGSPHRKDLEVDLRAPLPWPRDSIAYAYAGHLLEHLRVHEVVVFLGRLRSCMRDDGVLTVVGPDLDIAEGMAAAGTLDVTLDSLRCGADRWVGDRHRWECSAPAVVTFLRLTGWVDIRESNVDELPELWPVADRGPRWQCVVLATRGSDPPGDAA